MWTPKDVERANNNKTIFKTLGILFGMYISVALSLKKGFRNQIRLHATVVG